MKAPIFSRIKLHLREDSQSWALIGYRSSSGLDFKILAVLDAPIPLNMARDVTLPES